MVTLISMAYTSNLRYFITLPNYEPEINQDSDADKYFNTVHIPVPHEYKTIYYSFVKKISSSLFEKVRGDE